MRFFFSLSTGLLLLLSASLRAQEPGQPTAPAPAVSAPGLGLGDGGSGRIDPGEDRMLTPPPVSSQAYALAMTSEARSNYLRGGVTFNTAYSDNVLGSTSAAPVSDLSYSVWPTIAIDQTRPRLHWLFSYAPGFTFYQRTTARNESDQNLTLALQYRLSPHVTVSVRDGLQKSSNAFNQPGQGLAGAVSGSDLSANNSIVAPLADRLNNNGGADLTYQFSASDMVGADGNFSNLHYSNPNQVPGEYDAATRGASGFYSHRFSRQHYLGVSYQYQELLSYPAAGTNQTQTDAALLFYTFVPSVTFSLSLFGGPQYYNQGTQYMSAAQPFVKGMQSWKPTGGASLNWQGWHTAAALSYAHSVSGGGGLVGAVELDQANGSLRQQLTRNLGASLSAGYANNGVLSETSQGGHSVSASAALQRTIDEHFNVQAGYTRLHQTYQFFAANPDTNREWIGVTYQFVRPLGR